MNITFRKVISLSIAISFFILLVTGVLSYLNDYSRITATLHTVFGVLFSFSAVFHLINNYLPLKNYMNGKYKYLVISVVVLIFGFAYFQFEPFNTIMDFGARLKVNQPKELNISEYEIVEMNTEGEIKITIDLQRSKHYWHPQMAIWIEDKQGNFIESLFVSKATAKGLFFGGRSKENFKVFDETKDALGDYRRVDALPVWSHKRGIKYDDGMYVPTNDNPLPDAISGATIVDNFKMTCSTKEITEFVIRIELNVAFDDNEYYSDFDFPDDKVYHSGTGQLGQPSIVFQSEINMNDDNKYYFMELLGHGHHSSQDGEIYKDLSTLTTALEIVERIVVGVHSAVQN